MKILYSYLKNYRGRVFLTLFLATVNQGFYYAMWRQQIGERGDAVGARAADQP